MRPALRLVLTVSMACTLALAGCGGSDDDDDASESTASLPDVEESGPEQSSVPGADLDPSGSQAVEYCRVAREAGDLSPDEVGDAIAAQLEVAPPELEESLQALNDNVAILEDEDRSEADVELVREPFLDVLNYQADVCRIVIGLSPGS